MFHRSAVESASCGVCRATMPLGGIPLVTELLVEPNMDEANGTSPAGIAAHIGYLCRGEHAPKTDKCAKPCVSFLLGAGFSKSAGVPTAKEMVADPLRTHPLLQNAGSPAQGQSDYAFLMSQLPPAQRTQIIRNAIDKACDAVTGRLKINWAHLLLAAMVDHGYIHRILTTNFDPLVVEALAIMGQPIRTFDLTAAAAFQPGVLERGSVVYLHGQSHGLWLANTVEEMKRVEEYLPQVLGEAISESLLIVVGYSGENDPVLNALASIRQFPNRLYWIHYSNVSKEPCKQAMKIITDKSREAFLVNGYTADNFMRELVLEELKVSLPEIVLNPLSAVSNTLKRIMALPDRDNEPSGSDPVKEAGNLVARYIDAEADVRAARLAIEIAMASATRDVERLNELLTSVNALPPKDIETRKQMANALLSVVGKLIESQRFGDAKAFLDNVGRLGTTEPHWGAVMWAVLLVAEAKAKSGAEADALFAQAYEKYNAALSIKPDMYEALYNWGNALYGQAKTKSGTGADALFAQAYEKYNAALSIKPDTYEVFFNWGNALSDQAKAKSGTEADALFAQAYERYNAALTLKPDKHEAFFNWGNALFGQAKTKTDAEADRLFALAYEKYAAALRIKPDMHEAFFNWGDALFDQAKTKNGAEGDALYAQAYEKYNAALSIKPDMHEAFVNWGNALYGQAKTKRGADADALFAQAYEKYGAALRVKPDGHEALNNWGAALTDQAKTKSGAEADALFAQAYEMYNAALRIRPEMPELYYNLACLAALRKDVTHCLEQLRKWRDLCPQPRKQNIDTEHDFDAVRANREFQEFGKSLPE